MMHSSMLYLLLLVIVVVVVVVVVVVIFYYFVDVENWEMHLSFCTVAVFVYVI